MVTGHTLCDDAATTLPAVVIALWGTEYADPSVGATGSLRVILP